MVKQIVAQVEFNVAGNADNDDSHPVLEQALEG
jgi:hypothetical protein